MVVQPVKMMRYRGVDDDTINFGHFAEARKVRAGPNDVIPMVEGNVVVG
jgi:hypothetical protein